MSDFVKGKVSDIIERETSIGTMYDLVINGQKYGAGKYKPSVKIGQYVKAPIKQNGKYSNIFGKIQVISEEEAGPPAPARQGVSGASYGYGYNDEKRQAVISRQAARNSAISFLEILVAKDAVPIPASAKTPAQRFEVLKTFLDGLTEDFNNYAMGSVPAKAEEDGDFVDGGSDDGDFS